MNVALIVLDTARYGTVSELYSEFSGLNTFEGGGVEYSNVFSGSPWTLPSHASIFTATYPSKHGAHAGHERLSGDQRTLAEAFAAADYETVAVSNNTWVSEEFGLARGFETFVKMWQYVQADTDLGEIARTKEGTEKLRAVARRIFDGNPLANVANAVYGQFFRNRGDDGAKRTNKWISDWLNGREDDRPFFLFINYLEPHLEYRPPKEYAERFLPDGVAFSEAMDVPQDAWGYIAGTVEMTEHDFELLRSLYRAEIAYLNERIGELYQHLEDAGEWEDTVFVVTADHGENIGDHGLMDHQYCLYDTLLHVPLLIHGGPFTDGKTHDELVQLTDLGPTLLDVAGVDSPEFRAQAQGQSFHPDVDSDSRKFAIAEYLAPQPSMEALEKRVGTLPNDVRRYDRSLRAIRDGEWKLIRGSDSSAELYDVAEDPGERTDLSDTHPEQVDRLSSALDDWIDSFEHANVSGTVEMTDDTKQRLEDLGYLQ